MKVETTILPEQVQRFGVYLPDGTIVQDEFLSREAAEDFVANDAPDGWMKIQVYARNAETPNEQVEAKMWQRLQNLK